MRRFLCFASIVSVCSLVGCASDTSSGNTPEGTSTSELRALTPAEIVGALTYGDSASIAYTNRPLYRAWKMRLEPNATFSARVKAATGTSRVRVELVEESYFGLTTVDTKVGTDVTVSRRPSGFGTFFLVARTDDLTDATITVDIAKTGTPDRITTAFSRSYAGAYAPPSALVGTTVDALMQCRKDGLADSTAVLSLKFAATGVELLGADGVITGVGFTPDAGGNVAGFARPSTTWNPESAYVEAITVSANDARVEYVGYNGTANIVCVGHAR